MLFQQEFRDTVAAKALLEACLKLESGASNAIIDFNEMEEFSIMSLSLLPFWASQILPDMAINWYIQVDASFTQRLYGTGGWSKLGPSNDQSVFSHQNGSSVVFYEDSCSLLCSLSIDKSFCKRFSGWKVRILVPIPGHAIAVEHGGGDRSSILTSLLNPPQELVDSFTIWVRMDSLSTGFKRHKPPYGNAGENEAQSMFEALTTTESISIERLMQARGKKGNFKPDTLA